MSLAQLINAQQLAERLPQPDLVILDCRFALDDPQYGQRSYDEAHIPGAHFADLEKDLSGPVIPGKTGRHPLPEPDQLLAKLQALGVNADSQIVLYDDGPGAFAAHAWWLLVWLGKRDGLYLLDGGLRAWREAGLPLDDKRPTSAPGTLQGNADDSLTIDAATLSSQLASPDLTLLDARALPRFLGEVEPIDPVAGHIPGAHCLPFTENLDTAGRFLSPNQLRTRFEQHLAGKSSDSLVAYCGSGVTACHNLFALCLAGYPLARLYPGSWSEWITDPQRPVARQR
ncbi:MULTISPECIES: sulfurtransferase [Pseudomonadaceae]|uniref:Sulfurtransferase n=1 Tax=Pseudomonas saudiphocaensis TaxID=1499686 RepID=A0A078LRI0_9PSED|nr:MULTISPECIES: sulfurtransferase [Pseudomonadaceae]MBE7928559.1 sulfurtransferase [Pseudomonas saudiphocaensis]MCF6782069.1 sulfurtransferase [Stutzerimonas stutzeri]MCF6803681.1 sulfurtransferase [Stutzerimonas stutzeri]CDZ92952.1 3-mercaptopyruvate sulfurtransferase [Pseudomonas saudiphocaensis]